MELLLADKLGFPKGFNGLEWSSLPQNGIKKRQMPSYLVEDLPYTDGYSIRQKFKEVSFAEAPKIGYFNPFIKTNYSIYRKEQMKKQKINQQRKKKQDEKYIKQMIIRDQQNHSEDIQLQESTQEQLPHKSCQQIDLGIERHYSVSPSISSKPGNMMMSLLKEKMIKEKKEKKEQDMKKQQLIDDLHYYKIFADKCSRLTIECVDSIYKVMGCDDDNFHQSIYTDENQDLKSVIFTSDLDNNLKSDITNPKLNSSKYNKQSILLNNLPKDEYNNSINKLSQYQPSNSYSMFTKTKNSFQPSKTEISPNQTVPRSSKQTNFLEIDINKTGVQENDVKRGRNSQQFQFLINQQHKLNESEGNHAISRGSKRTSSVNQEHNISRFEDQQTVFFKCDETLNKTFQNGSKSSEKRKKNIKNLQSTSGMSNPNNSFIQTRQSLNQTRQSLDQSHLYLTQTPQNVDYNPSVSPKFLSTTKGIQSQDKWNKTPRTLSNIGNNNRFLTPQKNRELKQDTQIIEGQIKIVNKQNVKPNETKNNMLQNSNQMKQNQQNLQFKLQNNFIQSPNKNSILLSPKTPRSPTRNTSPSIYNQSQLGDADPLNQTRDSQFEYIKRKRDYFNTDFVKKSDVHHKSIMYAMKTLKKKFGIIKDKYDSTSIMF